MTDHDTNASKAVCRLKRWPIAQKDRIVDEAFVPGVTVEIGVLFGLFGGDFPRETGPMQGIGKMPVNLFWLSTWQKCVFASC
jgi:hypothetical protein